MTDGLGRGGMRSGWITTAVFLMTAAWGRAAETPDAAAFFDLARSPSPAVAFALPGDGQTLFLRVECPDGRVVAALDVALASADAADPTPLRLTLPDVAAAFDEPAPDGRGPARLFRFDLPPGRFGPAANLRFAVSAAWADPETGLVVARERFRALDRRAPHIALPDDPAQWALLDRAELERLVLDRRAAIHIDFVQPFDGKTTVVVETPDGRRIRNLVSGATFAAGTHSVAWDGFDEEGVLAPAGAYVWRALHHPGITPDYLRSFANGGETSWEAFGANHMRFTDAFHAPAVPGGAPDQIFLAAPMTEGGHPIISVDPQSGRWHWGGQTSHGLGMTRALLAADEQYLYTVQDGPAWGDRIDYKKPDWTFPLKIRVGRLSRLTGRTVDYPRDRRFIDVETYPWGPGGDNPRTASHDALSLRGAALVGNVLYIASAAQQALLRIDVATGEALADAAPLPLADPGLMAVRDGELFAFSGRDLLRLDPESGATLGKILTLPEGLEPTGLAAADGGSFFVADGAAHLIAVFDAEGRQTHTVGHLPAGPYKGEYIPERLVNPRGIAVAGSRLWFTEDRDWPKRAGAFDLGENRVVVEKFGSPPYGGPTAGMDPADPTRWIGIGGEWHVALDEGPTGTEKILNVVYDPPGHLNGVIRPQSMLNYRLHRQDGREFWIGMGKTTVLSERLPDGTFHDWAALSSHHQFDYATGWNLPESFLAAFDAVDPDKKLKDRALRCFGVLWVDRNGDGATQTEEFSFAPVDSQGFAGGGWGHGQRDLVFEVPAADAEGRPVRVRLAPRGFLPNGCPDYPSLAEAFAEATPLVSATPPGGLLMTETIVDSARRLLVNSTPFLSAFNPDGTEAWRFRNLWTNVHGSHGAPLPEPGVTQGTLFFLGSEPLDDEADVTVLNGNHGRFFLFTTDGLYLDEMFNDVRMGTPNDEFLVGGECFGGSFRRADDGTYYLQTGGSGLRIYRLRGLDQVRRARGAFTVTDEQRVSAARAQETRLAAAAAAGDATLRAARVERTPHPPGLDARNRNGWPPLWTADWTRSGRFRVQAAALFDDDNLYLNYVVEDDSPWRNTGSDWTLLFKTGDALDFQLGGDPDAKPNRATPVPGDLRLLIAPFGDQPAAVLYRPRVPGTAEPVIFSSPWRSEKIDEVKRLEDARISVDVRQGRYAVTAAVPWASLGLDPAQLAGRTTPADFGVIYGDPAGTINMLRSYWSNAATGLVNDVPGETALTPRMWGSLTFAE